MKADEERKGDKWREGREVRDGGGVDGAARIISSLENIYWACEVGNNGMPAPGPGQAAAACRRLEVRHEACLRLEPGLRELDCGLPTAADRCRPLPTAADLTVGRGHRNHSVTIRVGRPTLMLSPLQKALSSEVRETFQRKKGEVTLTSK